MATEETRPAIVDIRDGTVVAIYEWGDQRTDLIKKREHSRGIVVLASTKVGDILPAEVWAHLKPWKEVERG